MIEVRITKDLQDLLNNNTFHIGMRAKEDLQKAGAPVVGVCWPWGVTSGTLTSFFDETFEELIFTYYPEGESPSP